MRATVTDAMSSEQPSAGDSAAPESPATHEAPARVEPKTRRTRAFRALAVAFAAALVLLAEGACRLAGLGGHPPMWRVALQNESDGARLYETNAEALQPFFPKKISSGVHAQGSFRYERVLMPKPPGLIRVAVVGESSVEGFPFPRNLTAVSFLEAYLQALHPGKPIEVLNLGVTAVASYPVRVVAEQSLETLDLDLLVIYTGHNEFYGASGVASTQSSMLRFGGRDGSYVLRGTGIYQAVERAIGGAAEKSFKRPDNLRINLIEEMAAIKRIEPQGALHAKAAKVLEANLRAMIGAARRHSVPVVVCTLASNEKDLRPVQTYGDNADEVAKEALALLDGTDAMAKVDALGEAHPLNAMVPWVRATLLEREGRRDEALAEFRRARDLDAMPWRATTAINETIRNTARSEGALLVDAEEAFRGEAGGAVGWDLMADHLHPSLEGQGLLAETIARAVAQEKLLPGADPKAAVPPRGELARVLGANRLEMAEVHGRMAALFDNPPLAINNKDAAEYLRGRMRESTKDADAIESAAIARWNEAQGKGPQTPSVSMLAGFVCMDAGEYGRGAAYFAAAVGSMTPFGASRLRANYLSLLCLRQLGPLDGRRQAVLARCIGESAYVEQLAEPQHMGMVHASMGGLSILAGDHAAGRAWLGKALGAGFELGDAEAAMLQKIIVEQERGSADK